MSEWISVKKSLPERDQEVLITDGETIRVAYLDLKPGFFSDDWMVYGTATHWMDLPEAPKETE